MDRRSFLKNALKTGAIAAGAVILNPFKSFANTGEVHQVDCPVKLISFDAVKDSLFSAEKSPIYKKAIFADGKMVNGDEIFGEWVIVHNRHKFDWNPDTFKFDIDMGVAQYQYRYGYICVDIDDAIDSEFHSSHSYYGNMKAIQTRLVPIDMKGDYANSDRFKWLSRVKTSRVLRNNDTAFTIDGCARFNNGVLTNGDSLFGEWKKIMTNDYLAWDGVEKKTTRVGKISLYQREGLIFIRKSDGILYDYDTKIAIGWQNVRQSKAVPHDITDEMIRMALNDPSLSGGLISILDKDLIDA